MPSAIRSNLDTYQVLNECGGFELPGRRTGSGEAATVEDEGTPAPNEPEGFAGAGGRGEEGGPSTGEKTSPQGLDCYQSSPWVDVPVVQGPAPLRHAGKLPLQSRPPR